jgi:hypothetical protein
MITSKTKIMLKIFICLAFAVICSNQANAQTTHQTKDEAQKNAGSGVVFKTPGKFMKAPLSGFKGLMMLHPKRPAGIFISYPNEKESIADLTDRARNFLAKMFIHDEKAQLNWQTKAIAGRTGDKSQNANMFISDDGKTTVQITVFEREHNGLPLIYGYFAMKKNTDKKSDLLDETGKGSKEFEEFWKSLSGGK